MQEIRVDATIKYPKLLEEALVTAFGDVVKGVSTYGSSLAVWLTDAAEIDSGQIVALVKQYERDEDGLPPPTRADTLQERLDKLELRIAALEAKP
jgi:hypothetical protein